MPWYQLLINMPSILRFTDSGKFSMCVTNYVVSRIKKLFMFIVYDVQMKSRFIMNILSNT